jgi:hypothetical protein
MARVVSKGVVACTLKAVHKYEPKVVTKIYYDVLNDYGSISMRQVYGALALLVSKRKIRQVPIDDLIEQKKNKNAYLRR